MKGFRRFKLTAQKQSTEDKEREETKPKQNTETLENVLQKIQKIPKKSENETTTQSVSTIPTVSTIQQPATQEQLNLKVNRIQIKTLKTCEPILTRDINTNISEDGLYVVLFEYFRFNDIYNIKYKNEFQHIAQIYKINNRNLNYETLIKSNITQIIEKQISLYETHHPSITFNLYGQEIEFPLSDLENLIINYYNYNYDNEFKFIGKGYENIELLTWIYTQIIKSIKHPFDDYIRYKYRNRQLNTELDEIIEQYIKENNKIPFIKCDNNYTKTCTMHQLKNDKNNFGAYFGIFEINNGAFKFYNNETSTTNDNNELVKQDIKLFVNDMIININSLKFDNNNNNQNKNFEHFKITDKTNIESIYNTYIYQYLQNINEFNNNNVVNDKYMNIFLQNNHIINKQQQTFFDEFKKCKSNPYNNLIISRSGVRYNIKIENSQMKIIEPSVKLQNSIFTYTLNYYICMLAVINNQNYETKKELIDILNDILFSNIDCDIKLELMQKIYNIINNNNEQYLTNILNYYYYFDDYYGRYRIRSKKDIIDYLSDNGYENREQSYAMLTKPRGGGLDNEKIKSILKIILICLIIIIIVIVVIIIVKNRKSNEQFLKHKYK